MLFLEEACAWRVVFLCPLELVSFRAARGAYPWREVSCLLVVEGLHPSLEGVVLSFSLEEGQVVEGPFSSLAELVVRPPSLVVEEGGLTSRP